MQNKVKTIKSIYILLFLIFLFSPSCRKSTIPETFDNPIVKDVFTADPAALVYRNEVFIYTGHDQAPKRYRDYVMDEWLVFSTKDFVTLESHGPGLTVKDFKWANGRAWASQAIERGGKFYWYVSIDQPRTGGMAIGVAVSDTPEGPFKDALGEPLITSDMTPFAGQGSWTWDDIDPTVFIDKDGQAYLYFGNTNLKYVKLNKDMISIDTSETETGNVEDAITDVTIPRVAGMNFTEGAWLFEREGTYYLVYAGGWEEQLAYCVSSSPEGPWKAGGKIKGYSDNSNTSHPAVIEYQKEWFLIYHNGTLPGGDSWHRSVCVDRLYFEEDGSIRPVVTSQELQEKKENQI